MGSQLIAEGTAADPVVFTSLADDTYGAGGTFDTNNDGGATAPAAGNWGGLYFAPTSQGSIDQAQIAYAGGQVSIEGTFTQFAPVDIRQATVRITNTTFRDNTAAATAANDNRNGRGQIVEPGIVYVQFAQPVIADNVFINNSKNGDGSTNSAAAISIDVNSLNSLNVPDWGRSTGPADILSQYAGNFGPLVRGNELADNSINGMLVRGGILTTEGVWDDTDIVHVVEDQIVVPNLDTYGGLRLQSSPTASLVVKFSGASAGLTATGTLLEITDRVGGTVQVLGQPGHPVVLTSLSDDTVGAGVDPATGNVVTDTNNDGYNSAPQPGSWQGITLDQYSNDSNVAVAVETEPATGSQDENGTINTAQPLGELATTTQGGDDVLRLGFEVHGSIASDRANDIDIYSFQATAGTPVWIAVDCTSFSLDSVLQVIDADGNVIATSDNWREELGTATSLDSSGWSYQDVYSTNPRDPGLHVVLPGPAGQQRTYYVRISSGLADGLHVQADYPLLQLGGSIADGDTFTVTGSGGPLTFEFTTTGQVAVNNIAVLIPSGATAQQAVDAAIAAIANTKSGVDAVDVGNGRIAFLNASAASAVSSAITVLSNSPLIDFDSIVNDGDVLTVAYPGGTWNFEFDSDGKVTAGNIPISFNPGDSIDTIRDDAIAAINAVIGGGHAVSAGDGKMMLVGATQVSMQGLRTSGEYQLQIRLQPVYDHPGSTVQYADIRYATDGIKTIGLPGDTPLSSNVSETENGAGSDDSQATAKPVGNLLQSADGSITLSGSLNDNGTQRNVNWYQFTVNYGDTINSYSTTGSAYPVVFDMDYADGLVRPDTSLWIFDAQGHLILDGTDSAIADDQPTPGSSDPTSNLNAGSVGTHDPYIGPVYLLEGQTYYVAVSSYDVTPQVITASVNNGPEIMPSIRLEPVDSVQRVAEDNIGSEGDSGITPPPQTTLFPYNTNPNLSTTQNLDLSAVPYNFSDVVLYVLTDSGLETVDPFTGAVETTLGSPTGTTAQTPATWRLFRERTMTVLPAPAAALSIPSPAAPSATPPIRTPPPACSARSIRERERPRPNSRTASSPIAIRPHS